jgi:hypothetical protein
MLAIRGLLVGVIMVKIRQANSYLGFFYILGVAWLFFRVVLFVVVTLFAFCVLQCFLLLVNFCR